MIHTFHLLGVHVSDNFYWTHSKEKQLEEGAAGGLVYEEIAER